jgi:hypothetical protein
MGTSMLRFLFTLSGKPERFARQQLERVNAIDNGLSSRDMKILVETLQERQRVYQVYDD